MTKNFFFDITKNLNFEKLGKNLFTFKSRVYLKMKKINIYAGFMKNPIFKGKFMKNQYA